MRDNINWAYVQVPRKADNADRGKLWVPAPKLRVNFNVYFGEVRWHEGVGVVAGPAAPSSSLTRTSQFGKAIEGQFVAWSREGLALGVPLNIDEIMKDSNKRGQLMNRIRAGCQAAGTLDVLNKSDFTLKDLVDSAKNAQHHPGSGIYLNCYRDFKDSPAKLPAIRTGKTVLFSSRTQDHIRKGKPDSKYEGERTHYDTARKAHSANHMVVCILTDSTDHEIAEQLFTNLLETYAPGVTAQSFEEFTRLWWNQEADVTVAL